MNPIVIVLLVILGFSISIILYHIYLKKNPEKKNKVIKEKNELERKKEERRQKINDYFDNSHGWLFWRKDKK